MTGLRCACFMVLPAALTACSMQKFAINKVGDALASGGTVYESDEDLVLVGDALPFSLKLIESLLAQSPRHEGLLLAASKGFTSYSYIYVHSEADVLATENLARARALRTRARKLYLRAHRYGLRGLEIEHAAFGKALSVDPRAAVAVIDSTEDVPLLYWTAASLGLAISAARNDPSLLARLPEVNAMLGRAFELDEAWEGGMLHAFEVRFAGARPGDRDFRQIEAHFQRAAELSMGRRAGLYVAYAEAVAIPAQDRALFESLLEEALAIDPDEHEALRLANLVAQRRARWLRSRVDQLILTAPEATHEKGGSR